MVEWIRYFFNSYVKQVTQYLANLVNDKIKSIANYKGHYLYFELNNKKSIICHWKYQVFLKKKFLHDIYTLQAFELLSKNFLLPLETPIKNDFCTKTSVDENRCPGHFSWILAFSTFLGERTEIISKSKTISFLIKQSRCDSLSFVGRDDWQNYKQSQTGFSKITTALQKNIFIRSVDFKRTIDKVNIEMMWIVNI